MWDVSDVVRCDVSHVVTCDVWCERCVMWDASDVVRCDVWCELCGEMWWDVGDMVGCHVRCEWCGEMWCEVWLLWWDVVRCDVRCECCGEMWCEMWVMWWDVSDADVMWDVTVVVKCDVRCEWCGEMWCEMWVMWWNVMWDVSDVMWDVSVVVRCDVWCERCEVWFDMCDVVKCDVRFEWCEWYEVWDVICPVFYYCMPRIDHASFHFVCTLFGVSCRDNSWIENKGPSLHVLQEAKLKFLPNISRFIPNQWLSAHIHLKKIKSIGFKSGLAWKKICKKYANKNYLGMALLWPKDFSNIKRTHLKNSFNGSENQTFRLCMFVPTGWKPRQ